MWGWVVEAQKSDWRHFAVRLVCLEPEKGQGSTCESLVKRGSRVLPVWVGLIGRRTVSCECRVRVDSAGEPIVGWKGSIHVQG